MPPRWLLCPVLLLPLVSGALAATEPSPRSCAQEIGRQPAQALATRCRALSPATHPPCNAANSCAIIEDEIARSCALLGDEAATTSGCSVDPKSDAAAVEIPDRGSTQPGRSDNLSGGGRRPTGRQIRLPTQGWRPPPP